MKREGYVTSNMAVRLRYLVDRVTCMTTCIDMTKKLTALRVKVESGNMMNYSEWCSLNSYKGWLISCDSFRLYQKYIEPLLPYADDYYKYNIKPKSKKGQKAA